MFRRPKKVPQAPAAVPPARPSRGVHTDESHRVAEVRPGRGVERKRAAGRPLGEHQNSAFPGTRQEFDTRTRNHPQRDRYWRDRWQGRGGPV
ncbi:hypothetical protein [Candidatus Frankia alpina]|uniref:Uncharacterized protein n=1 Tax=Candidatus Frankia alpina TaxID=2699483 RepID=A0A4S5C4E0_9ACTN|nr:hypothetical protein [Candidatus Frankia alpina]THJ37418.1 hypothetical protein E7Y31_21435 [Candidatus Frankia alpina]